MLFLLLRFSFKMDTHFKMIPALRTNGTMLSLHFRKAQHGMTRRAFTENMRFPVAEAAFLQAKEGSDGAHYAQIHGIFSLPRFNIPRKNAKEHKGKAKKGNAVKDPSDNAACKNGGNQQQKINNKKKLVKCVHAVPSVHKTAKTVIQFHKTTRLIFIYLHLLKYSKITLHMQVFSVIIL